jgi:hypothetical protein
MTSPVRLPQKDIRRRFESKPIVSIQFPGEVLAYFSRTIVGPISFTSRYLYSQLLAEGGEAQHFGTLEKLKGRAASGGHLGEPAWNPKLSAQGPPPMTTNSPCAFTAAHASRMPHVPALNAYHSYLPAGWFQMIVFAL